MITALLYKIVPWYFELAPLGDYIKGWLAWISGIELAVEILMLICILVVVWLRRVAERQLLELEHIEKETDRILNDKLKAAKKES